MHVEENTSASFPSFLASLVVEMSSQPFGFSFQNDSDDDDDISVYEASTNDDPAAREIVNKYSSCAEYPSDPSLHTGGCQSNALERDDHNRRNVEVALRAYPNLELARTQRWAPPKVKYTLFVVSLKIEVCCQKC